jgi:hypothetical protein
MFLPLIVIVYKCTFVELYSNISELTIKSRIRRLLSTDSHLQEVDIAVIAFNLESFNNIISIILY